MKENLALKKSVGIWIRVSTDDQAKGDSPEHHEERARAYAKSRGWNVKEIYDLAGQSGKAVMQHPECKRMMDDVKRGHIQPASSGQRYYPAVVFRRGRQRIPAIRIHRFSL